ncbi:MAG: YicC/YloC family endoribonuclease [Spirochaetia bacterium]
MTGYGNAERQDERFSAVVEVKSYNNRYLDINCSLPVVFSQLEKQIRDRVAGVARRGRIEVLVRFRDNEEDLAVSVDRSVVNGYLNAFSELKAHAGIQEDVRLDHLLSREGVLKSERVADADRAWSVIEPLLDVALRDFGSSRRAEGRRLALDIENQLGRIDQCVHAFETYAGQIEETIRNGLQRRFAEVLGNEVDENRVLSEVAVQLTRFSINEEIVRLRAHLESFRKIGFGAGKIAADDGPEEPVGKKLDFLCQELNREINTTGSKSILVEVSQQVVEAKDALENVREQLRNVE